MAGVTLFDREVREELHFDLFRGLSHLSLPLLTADELWQESQVHRDVRRLTPRMEVLSTVLHRTVFGGTLNKPAYVEQLRALLEESPDGPWLEERVRRVLGPALAAELTSVERLASLSRDGSARAARARRAVLRGAFRRSPVAAAGSVVRFAWGQLGSMLRPPGVVGRPRDPVPGLPGERLSTSLASALSIYGFSVPHVRAGAGTIETLNPPRYADMLRERWHYWAPLRTALPSVFLWLQAKRAGVVVVDRLPWALRILRRTPFRPRWLARPARPPTAGGLVALTGPDGVGKTTVARALLDDHEGPTGYVHFRPPTRGALEPGPPAHSVPSPPKDFGPERWWNVAGGWARLGRSFVRFWAGYLGTVRPAVRRGALVVADRWVYGYVVQPRALKFYGPDWLARLVVAWMPRPDAVAVLLAPPAVVQARKDELTLPEIEAELARWRDFHLHDPFLVDATHMPAEIAATIRQRLQGQPPSS